MSGFKVHSGDFLPGSKGKFMRNGIILCNERYPVIGEHIWMRDIENVDVVGERFVQKTLGLWGWAFVGAVAADLCGAIVGSVLGGWSEEITFTLTFRDGRTVVASTDRKTFRRFLEWWSSRRSS